MKLFHYDSDATLVEKIMETIVPLFVFVLIFLMNLWGWGVGKNCYAQTCRHYGFGWHLAGLFLSIYRIYFFWRAATDRSTLNIGDGVRMFILFLIFAASWLSYSGFTWYFNVCQ
jgi:hypothetical protein